MILVRCENYFSIIDLFIPFKEIRTKNIVVALMIGNNFLKNGLKDAGASILEVLELSCTSSYTNRF